MKIAAPVPPLLVKQGTLFEPGPEVSFESEPFARQVTWRLMGALQTVGNEVASGHFDRLLSAVPSGVTANLCDTITTEFGRVRLLLSLPEYQLACDAHKNQKRVSSTGLHKVGAKHNNLLHPKGFRVLNDPS